MPNKLDGEGQQLVVDTDALINPLLFFTVLHWQSLAFRSLPCRPPNWMLNLDWATPFMLLPMSWAIDDVYSCGSTSSAPQQWPSRVPSPQFPRTEQGQLFSA